MTLIDFVENIAHNALQHPQIYLKGGHNGPYFHRETALRNKGHWLITFCKLYEWTGKEAYKQKAAEIAEYLLSREARPCGYSFYHRDAPKKDRCNGLIGQAWTFEALAQASETFKNTSFSKLVEEVFFQHHFNEKHALWNILEVNGKVLPIDNAFNHQLWFAASISLIKSDNVRIHERLTLFLDELLNNLSVLESGLIYHEFDFEPMDSYAKVQKVGVKGKLKQKVMQVIGVRCFNTDFSALSPEEKKKQLWKKMKHKSIGYHAFNTYAFALLKQKYPEHPVWDNPLFIKIVNYLFTTEYKKGIEDNEFSFAYNPPGFEVPFSVHALLPSQLENFLGFAQEWVNWQIALTYNKRTKFFDRNNRDPLTLTARLYEITRIAPSVLGKICIKSI